MGRGIRVVRIAAPPFGLYKFSKDKLSHLFQEQFIMGGLTLESSTVS